MRKRQGHRRTKIVRRTIVAAVVEPIEDHPRGSWERMEATRTALRHLDAMPSALMSMRDIALALGVQHQTVRVWCCGRSTVPFPAPDDTSLPRYPLWRWETIRWWAEDAGKLFDQADGPMTPAVIPKT